MTFRGFTVVFNRFEWWCLVLWIVRFGWWVLHSTGTVGFWGMNKSSLECLQTLFWVIIFTLVLLALQTLVIMTFSFLCLSSISFSSFSK